MKDWLLALAFGAIPYLSLAILLVALLYRYFITSYLWNTNSSQLLERKWLMIGSFLFHYGIIGSFFGHIAGLFFPQQSVWSGLGIQVHLHLLIEKYAGGTFGTMAFLGAAILLGRRLAVRKVYRGGSANSIVVLALLLIPLSSGVWNTWFLDYNYLFTIAPWSRRIIALIPQPSLMKDIPVSFWVHILAAFVFFAYLPFSKAVHLFSVPVPYLRRRFILFRKRKMMVSQKAPNPGGREN